MTQKFIGLMSGTSRDSLDACLVSFDGSFNFLQGKTINFDKKYKTSTDQNFIEKHITEKSVELVKILINRSGVNTKDIAGIAFSGQTISHNNKKSIQAGDPSYIAKKIGLPVHSDFRNEDIKRGGRGAPLIPIFHQYLYGSLSDKALIINIGGISNGTYLKNNAIDIGSDIGPGNCLMDKIVTDNHLGNFDEGGKLASTGKVDKKLLVKFENALLKLNYPRADDISLYTSLLNHINEHPVLDIPDQLATLAELTATKIYEFYLYCDQPNKVIFHGGGVFNKTLMKKISNKLGKYQTTESIMPSKYMEAAAFAYLAYKDLGVIFK
ncbi:MAG: anhydro-N-acetylmuramic acid kinase [SAR86 cluster bacterium]|uniref:Anhydro-N-acetylmuramic acid kinase n=1 Tax=SAR86 cluster bacterium TaxID=2030880 RepID=A0A937LI78_9GAMM|nr:anhydro-N-acetylmuramic acid kinase [SAR86 cluster bacterium]